MALPLDLQFRNLEPSSAVEAEVRAAAQGLDGRLPADARCRVVVEAAPARGGTPSIHHVEVCITTADDDPPGAPLARAHRSDPVLSVAVQEAFAAVANGARPDPDPLGEGHILRLRLEDGFGTIATDDGREVYFHRNALVGASFDGLRVGMTVRYVEIRSDLGPRAKQVEVVSG